MKKSYTLLVLITCYFFIRISTSFSQTPVWGWANGTGGIREDNVTCSASDATGNLYVAGYFKSDSIQFGSIKLYRQSTNNQKPSIFLVKYNAAGTALWAKAEGDSCTTYINNIHIDAAGYIYLAGQFGVGSILFDTIPITNNSEFKIYVAKCDSNGNAIWVKTAGGPGMYGCYAYSIITDSQSNVIVTGYHYTTMNFGSGIYLTHDAQSDIFTAKYDSNGNILWAKTVGNNNYEEALGVTVDAADNIYITGNFNSPYLAFDTDTLLRTATNSIDIFLTKYNPAGNVLWTQICGQGNYGGTPYGGIISDVNGDIIMAGAIGSSAPIIFGNDTLNTKGLSDAFVVKFDTSGAPIWARSAGNTKDDIAYGVTSDALGNIYITGSFSADSILFGNTILHNTSTTNMWTDIFCARYDASGNNIWAIAAGATQNDVSNTVACNNSGNVFIAGHYEGSAITFGSTVLNFSSGFDPFIASISTATGLVETFSDENLFQLYPNPGQESFTISAGKQMKNPVLRIYNSSGAEVRIEKLHGNFFSEKITMQLPAGIYFAKLTDASQEFYQKLVIE